MTVTIKNRGLIGSFRVQVSAGIGAIRDMQLRANRPGRSMRIFQGYYEPNASY